MSQPPPSVVLSPRRLPPAVAWPRGEPKKVRKALLKWHRGQGRHDLPWITTEDTAHRDYRVALSEVMLQQTTVSTGLKRYPRWLEQFPTWDSLASAAPDTVMKAWEGLGYYARARALHAMAKLIVGRHDGIVPIARADRLALPGVGPSTASALGAFIYGAREPIWDANVNRIWRRWWGDRWPTDLTPSQERAWIWEMARSAMPTDPTGIRDWTQAVMDLGATVCTARSPDCSSCPWRESCRGFALGSPEMFGASTVVTKVKEVQLTWLLVRNALGQVAIRAPVASGIWSGLYGLPLWEAPTALDAAVPSSTTGRRLMASGSHRLSHRAIAWRMEELALDDVPAWELSDQLSSQAPTLSTGPLPTRTLVWVSPGEVSRLAWPKPLRDWWDSTAGQGWLAQVDQK